MRRQLCGPSGRPSEGAGWIRRALCAAAVVLLASTGAAAKSPPRFTGAFSGTGRACYGKLFVRTKTISWLTTFSQCQKAAYDIVEQHENGNERQFAFQLRERAKGCRFGVIYLHHRDDPDPDIAWEAIGYASLDDYRADKEQGFKGDAPTAMSCYLVRD